MAILNHDQIFDKLNERLGSDTSPEAISFLEDMTDTITDLENRANNDNTNWEERYHELDENWKKKYKERFFSGGTHIIPDESEPEKGKKSATEITVDDLFE